MRENELERQSALLDEQNAANAETLREASNAMTKCDASFFPLRARRAPGLTRRAHRSRLRSLERREKRLRQRLAEERRQRKALTQHRHDADELVEQLDSAFASLTTSPGGS